MPAFGKRVKEESINDKMVRLFKEGKSVAEISKELEVNQDVVTRVIRRRCGEDSIPETVVRSKNAVPHSASEPAPVKAETSAPAEPVKEAPAEEPAQESAESLSRLERFMYEKEVKRQEEAEKVEEKAAAEPVDDTTGEMEGISLEGLDLDSLGSASDGAITPASVGVPATEAISDISEPEPVIEEAVAEPEPESVVEEISIEEPVVEEHSIEEPVVEELSVEEPVIEEIAPASAAPAIDLAAAHSGSAFDKMKAFAKMQIEANNEKLAALQAQLDSVEGQYTSQLEEAEKEVSDAKQIYEDVITKGESLSDKRQELQAEHRAALARAEEDYRKKLDEIEKTYNEAIAHANSTFAEKESELTNEFDTIDSQKETAKNNFLEKQSKVVEIKEKIESEVGGVKKQIADLIKENKDYESLTN